MAFQKAFLRTRKTDYEKTTTTLHVRQELTIVCGGDERGTTLTGSLLPQSTVPSYRDGEKRNAIIAAMSKPTKDGFWELQRDYVLASPSTAASYCSGRSCNGWLHWINNVGQSLDELYRGE